MPLPRQLGFTPANVHDLTALRPVLEELQHTFIFADKAYADQELKEKLQQKHELLLTMPKKGKQNRCYSKNFIRLPIIF